MISSGVAWKAAPSASDKSMRICDGFSFWFSAIQNSRNGMKICSEITSIRSCILTVSPPVTAATPPGVRISPADPGFEPKVLGSAPEIDAAHDFICAMTAKGSCALTEFRVSGSIFPVASDLKTFPGKIHCACAELFAPAGEVYVPIKFKFISSKNALITPWQTRWKSVSQYAMPYPCAESGALRKQKPKNGGRPNLCSSFSKQYSFCKIIACRAPVQ